MIAPSHAATTYAPMRGLSATIKPAAISRTPTSSMKACALMGSNRAIEGATYLSQLVSRWKNLSRPASVGAAGAAHRPGEAEAGVVGDREIEAAIAVEVGGDQVPRLGAGGEAERRGEGAAARRAAQVHALAVGGGEIDAARAGEVGADDRV